MSNVLREPLPADGIMTQHSLGKYDYSECNDPIIEFELMFDIKSDKSGKKTIYFYYEIPSINDLDISISCNCTIIIKLSDDRWRWSTNYQALTTKCPHYGLYQGLRYINKKGEFEWTYGMTEKYKQIKFHANEKAPPSVGNEFCLNVEFKVPGTDLWLPIVIDPVIINPRPIGFLFEFLNIDKKTRDPVKIPLFGLNKQFDFVDDYKK
jgi:hypothetical protein